MFCLPVFCFSEVVLVVACFTAFGLAADGGVTAGLVLLAGLECVLALAEAIGLAAFLEAASLLGGATFWLLGIAATLRLFVKEPSDEGGLRGGLGAGPPLSSCDLVR